MKSVPNEFLERYYPLRIEQYNTVADSGGPGLFRGGNAQRIFYRFLEEGEISLHDDRWLSKPWGVLGGEPGARSSKTLVHFAEQVNPPRREVLASKQDHVRVSVGDVLEWITWGGGGYGDALNRNPELIALEVSRVLVRVEGARRYGVVLTPESCVNVQATDELRSRLRGSMKKDPVELINRGGTWEELKAKALEETGLPPPKDIWTVPLRGPMTGLPHIKAWIAEHGQQVV